MMSASASSNFEEWLGVSCFSENHNNSLMWSHYADSHKGILLEFQKSEEGTLAKNLLPIKYYKKFPIINVSDYKKEEMMSIAYQVICAKGSSWKYENEWRALMVPGSRTHSFEKHELTGVVFGLKVEIDVIEELREILSKSNYKNISFSQATLLEKKFDLAYEYI